MLPRPSPAAFLVFVTAICLTGCGQTGINGPVEVAAGSSAEGASTINGSVTVGEGATVGEAAAVNGGVHLHEKATASSARTVNGGIELDDGARVTQNVEAVNGSIRLGKSADVGGSVSNINGGIRIDGAHVGKGVSTFTGDIDIKGGSRIEGGIHLKKPDFGDDSKRIPRVTIGADAIVEGTLKFDREVKLLVSDAAKIGAVEGATVQLFSGDDTSHLIEAAAPAAATGEAPAEKPADKPAPKAAQKP
jgi:hypothetical protein